MPTTTVGRALLAFAAATSVLQNQAVGADIRAAGVAEAP